jgi:hypothetical protein
MGTTVQRVYEISDFKGLNLHDEARKIEPGQFTVLTNASTDNNSIKADAIDALISMPVPKILSNAFCNHFFYTPWIPTSAYAASTEFAYHIPSGINETLHPGDSVNVLVPFTCSVLATGTDFMSATLYNTDASGNPGLNISINAAGLGYVATASAALTNQLSDFYVSKELMMISSASVNDWWVGLKGSGVVNASKQIPRFSAKQTTSTASKNWQDVSGMNWWGCIISRHTLTGGHVLNIYPFISSNESQQFSASVPTATGNKNVYARDLDTGAGDFQPFSRLYVDKEPNYKSVFDSIGGTSFVSGTGAYGVNSLVQATATGNISINKYFDFNVVEVSAMALGGNESSTRGIQSFTSPENRNGIIFDYGNDFIYGTSPSAYAVGKYRRKSSYCFFNGYFVPARMGQLCAYQFNSAMPMGGNLQYCLNVQPLVTPTFNSPKGVISYNNFLMYYNVKGIASGNNLQHRMYFSTAGMVDAFSSNQYENLSDGEEALHIEEWYGSLLVFFADRVKRYTGTPGNATLETVFYRGVSCAEMVCKTGRGIFFVSTDGLYLYNGTFNRIMDWSTKFDQANSRNIQEDGWLEFNDKQQELYFYPGYDSVVNVWNAKHNFFRQKDYTTAVCTGGMRFFKYYHNMDLKTAISYPGITHVSQVEAGTTYRAARAKSGWIDVSEGQGNTSYEKKHFDRAIIEYNACQSGYFDFTVHFDDGQSKVFSGINLAGITPGIVSYQVPLDYDAKLIQYEINCPEQSEQMSIHKIKIYFSDTILK